MNVRQAALTVLVGGLLAGCAGPQEPVKSDQQKDSELSALHKQMDVMRSQMEVERTSTNSLKTQITSLEGRLRAMQDMLMAKDEEIARLEAQLQKAKPKKSPRRKS